MIEHLLAITLAFLIGSIVGDPPAWPHPVKWIGHSFLPLDKKWNHGLTENGKGISCDFSRIGSVLLLSYLIIVAAYQIHFLVGLVVESILISTTIAHKSLKDAAMDVYIHWKRGISGMLALNYLILSAEIQNI